MPHPVALELHTGNLSCLALFLERTVHILNYWAISLAIHLILFSKSLTEPETHCSHRLDGQQATGICLPLSACTGVTDSNFCAYFSHGVLMFAWQAFYLLS